MWISNWLITTLSSEQKVHNRAVRQLHRHRVTGVVKDHMGDPVIGANIVEKGTTNGTITDIDGRFSIEVSPGATLIISYIGYLSKEIQVNNQRNIQVNLVEDTQTLGEVVVVGFGSQKKENLTGAVSQVKNDGSAGFASGDECDECLARNYAGVADYRQ